MSWTQVRDTRLRSAAWSAQRAIRHLQRNASIPITSDAPVEALIAAVGRADT